MPSVTIPADYYSGTRVPETKVTVEKDGGVLLDGERIGLVRKGTRTYSPPVHRGSRIVKYHKQVPEWHGWSSDLPLGRPELRADTRVQVLGRMVAAFGKSEAKESRNG